MHSCFYTYKHCNTDESLLPRQHMVEEFYASRTLRKDSTLVILSKLLETDSFVSAIIKSGKETRQRWELSQPHPHTRGGWKRCAATLIGPFLLQLYLTSKGEEKNSNSRSRTKRERSESRWSRLDGKRSVFEELQRVPSLTHPVLKKTHYS